MRNSIGRAAWLFFIWTLGLTGSASAAVDLRTERAQRELVSHVSSGCANGAFNATCLLLGTDRRKVFDDIYEYTYRIRVGAGTYDVITLHRVVRESHPLVPAPGPRSVFLVHGDVWGFRGAFMSSLESDSVPHQQSFAIYLARKGVDVWGIDLRWVDVPPHVSDFTFMKDWDLSTHAQDVGVGLAIARLMRLLTLQGAGPMPLLGWSRGATVSYAYLNMEAQWSKDKRQVDGFIPVDMAYVFAPEAQAQRIAACAGYTVLSGMHDSGLYEGGAVGALLQAIGAAAKSSPQFPSPVVTGASNLQAALVAGSATYMLQGLPVFQGYHFTGGVFVNNLPTRLSWTQDRFFFDTLEQASPFQSLGEQVDTLALWCGALNVSHDDHLKKVTVPVLYIGAAGGTGRFGLHSLLKLGSKDLTAHIVQRMPNESAMALDYGHQDLFIATDAESQVWKRVWDWLAAH